MPEPEAVKVTFGCGPGICDMDVAQSKDEGERIYIGGAEGYLKVRVVSGMMGHFDDHISNPGAKLSVIFQPRCTQEPCVLPPAIR